jgi:hypothetical protein
MGEGKRGRMLAVLNATLTRQPAVDTRKHEIEMRLLAEREQQQQHGGMEVVVEKHGRVQSRVADRETRGEVGRVRWTRATPSISFSPHSAL